MGVAGIESQVKPGLSIGEDAYVYFDFVSKRGGQLPRELPLTHQALICDVGIALEVEQHGHVILVICCIEAGDIDQGIAQAVPKVLGV